MITETAIGEIIAQLEGGPVAERRAAVRRAVELLRRADCAEPCRSRLIAALRAAAEGDAAQTVRDLAREALTNLPVAPSPEASLLPDDRQHMLGVRCPNGHVTYFDKRRICTEQTGFVRSLVRDEAGRELDELALPCGQCDAVVKVRLDCGGYR
jgi:hypothetical protein